MLTFLLQEWMDFRFRGNDGWLVEDDSIKTRLP